MSTLKRLIFFATAVAAGILHTELSAQSVTPTMKAIVIHEYGGPEILKYEDIPRPEPEADQLLIRVVAAGVNPVDGMIRSGLFAKDGSRTFPIILGGDVAGVVEKIGSKVTKFKAGDPVFAYVSLDNSGGYAQYALVKESEAAPKPKSLTYVEAAGVPIRWRALAAHIEVYPERNVWYLEEIQHLAGATPMVGVGVADAYAVVIARDCGRSYVLDAVGASPDEAIEALYQRTYDRLCDLQEALQRCAR